MSTLEVSELEQALPPDAQRLRDRVAVVTGSASGIGRATAALFAAHGATVVGLDVNEIDGEAAVALLRKTFGDDRAEFMTVDVGNRAQVAVAAADILARHPRVDVLFNNAGIIEAFRTPVEAAELDTWARIADVNLTGVLALTKGLLPGLKASGRASVVINSSVDGVFGNPHVPLYSISKGGLIPMTHVMAHEFGPSGVRVNCIVPAGITSGMSEKSIDQSYANQLASATPLGRMGTAIEVARVVLFLASDDSSYVSGAVLAVDGGRTGMTAGTL